jgi:hypothetical protein
MPIWFLFAGTALLILLAIEAGFRLGHVAHRKSEDEKESPVGAIAGSILGLLAFILAFTFGMASDRYDSRKELVRQDAGSIRTAFLRSDFLPEADRMMAADLLRKYTEVRLSAVRSGDVQKIQESMDEIARIQKRLWNMAVANARLDMNSDVAALYIESLNEMFNFHALRISVGLQSRIPAAIWRSLYALVVLGMVAVGYQTGIAGSKRSWTMPILSFSFSLVLALIYSMDRPMTHIIQVSQQPLENVRAEMVPGPGALPSSDPAP